MKTLLSLALALVATAVIGAEPIAPGRAQISIPLRDETVDVFTYRPSTYRDGPLLVVMHGLNRNADEYRDNAVSLADQLHALVMAPRFPADRFPTEAYQHGGVMDDGEAQPQSRWTFSRVSELIDIVRENEGRPDMPYVLIGHSAGGQFLDRMAAFLPGSAKRIVAANPGTLLFPTRDQKYPLGFGGLPPELGSDERIKAYLAAPLTLYLGTADLLPTNLARTPEANLQGATRFERGHACFAAAQKLARERGWPFQWRLVEAPEIGHTAEGMFSHPQAMKILSDAFAPAPAHR